MINLNPSLVIALFLIFMSIIIFLYIKYTLIGNKQENEIKEGFAKINNYKSQVELKYKIKKQLFFFGVNLFTQFKNVLLKNDLLIYDYQINKRGSGGGTYTIAEFNLINQEIPNFKIIPRNISTNLINKLNLNEIDMKNHSKFNSKYILLGEEKIKILNLLTSEIINLIENFKFIERIEIENNIISFCSKKDINLIIINSQEIREKYQENLSYCTLEYINFVFDESEKLIQKLIK